MRFSQFLSLAFLMLLTFSPARADHEADAVEGFVREVCSWSLDQNNQTLHSTVIVEHPEDFNPELYDLLKFISSPHPDAGWLYTTHPLWWLDHGQPVQELSIGKPMKLGNQWLVDVRYKTPSMRATRPPVSFRNIWSITDGDSLKLNNVWHSLENEDVTSLIEILRPIKTWYDGTTPNKIIDGTWLSSTGPEMIVSHIAYPHSLVQSNRVGEEFRIQIGHQHKMYGFFFRYYGDDQEMVDGFYDRASDTISIFDENGALQATWKRL